MNVRLRIAVLLPIAAVLAAVAVGCALAARGSTTTYVAAGTGTPSQLEIGKQLYRKYCGQCHALIAALAAGFGCDKGLGTDGGPSFNNLKVPYNLSIVAVTEQFGGHELVVKRMTWEQLGQVSPLRRRRDEHQPVPRAHLRRLTSRGWKPPVSPHVPPFRHLATRAVLGG